MLYGPAGVPLSPQTAAVVDPSFNALRASWRPWSYRYGSTQVLGIYTLAVEGSFTVLSGPVMLAMRWTSSNALMVLLRVKYSWVYSAAPAAGGFSDEKIFHWRNWTVAPAGPSVTIPGANMVKTRKDMADSQATAYVDFSDQSGGAGTVVFDPVPFAAHMQANRGTAAGEASIIEPSVSIYRPDIQAGEQPHVFYQNEGWAFYTGFSAAGVGRWSVAWAEVALPTYLEV